MKIVDIAWDTDGFLDQRDLGLPTEVDLPDGVDADDDDAINDYLSDTYGWLTIEWFKRGKYEVYDINDEVIATEDDLLDAQDSAEVFNAKFILDTETNIVVWGSI